MFFKKKGALSAEQIIGLNKRSFIESKQPLTENQIQIKLSHTRAKTLQIKSLASEEKRQQINSLVKSLNKLREQMLARTNI